jgi:hypothetical protein
MADFAITKWVKLKYHVNHKPRRQATSASGLLLEVGLRGLLPHHSLNAVHEVDSNPFAGRNYPADSIDCQRCLRDRGREYHPGPSVPGQC